MKIMNKNLYNKIIEIVGKKNLITKDKDKVPYVSGWRSTPGKCELVVFPRTLLEMWETLQVLVANKRNILMQASNTSLTGGSTPSGDNNKKLAIINTLKLNKIIPINKGKQIIAFPGSTLHELEKILKPLNRSPHSEIGSSCIGASIIGGICNNSGGALIKRGPAYTELSLFAGINKNGKLALYNKLGINLGRSPENILKNLDNNSFSNKQIINTNAKASSSDYKNVVKNYTANSPARYNADKSRLYDASGCAGKIAVFSVRVDTFEKEQEERTFYYSTNDAKDLTKLRKKILSEIDELPIYAEYMHRDAYEVSKKYGKDAFLLIHHLGTETMPFFYKMKSRLDRYFQKSIFFSNRTLDLILQGLVSFLPNHMPKNFDKLNKNYKHHLILKCNISIYKNIINVSNSIFNNKNKNYFTECNVNEGKKLILNRFVFAGASARFANLSKHANQELLALDVALRRNDKNWENDIAPSAKKDILKTLTVAHFFCFVFHREYVVKKGKINKRVKNNLLTWLNSIGAKYPAEHNVGHMYEAEKALKKFYRKLDPTDTFNPGIGIKKN